MSELVFASSVPHEAYKIKKMLKEKKIRKISPRIYSTNFEDEPEAIIRRNFFTILTNLYPGAMLSHRSAFEVKPADSKHIYITHSYTKKVRIPGLTIHFLEGKGPQEDDIKIGNLYASSQERAFLENLQVSKKKGAEGKTLPVSELEKRLDRIITLQGEGALTGILDRAEELSQLLNMGREFELLNKMIHKVLGEREEK